MEDLNAAKRPCSIGLLGHGMMDVVNIACAVDDDYVAHCGVMLHSLFVNNPGLKFNIFLFSGGLERQNENSLKEFVDKSSHQIVFVEIGRSELQDAPVFGHVSFTTYIRLLIPNLIDTKIQKILYLDSDIIVRQSISPLWDTQLREYAHAAVEDYGITAEFKENLGIPVDAPYFNAGVLLVNLPLWRHLGVTSKTLKFLRSQPERITYWDQDALNYVLHDKWLSLHPKWNAQAFTCVGNPDGLDDAKRTAVRLARQNPAIVHFTGAGPGKPWHYYCDHPFKDEYSYYRKQTLWRRFEPLEKPTLKSRLKARCRMLCGGFIRLPGQIHSDSFSRMKKNS